MCRRINISAPQLCARCICQPLAIFCSIVESLGALLQLYSHNMTFQICGRQMSHIFHLRPRHFKQFSFKNFTSKSNFFRRLIKLKLNFPPIIQILFKSKFIFSVHEDKMSQTSQKSSGGHVCSRNGRRLCLVGASGGPSKRQIFQKCPAHPPHLGHEILETK